MFHHLPHLHRAPDRHVAGEGPRDPGALRGSSNHGPAGDFCAPPATGTHNAGARLLLGKYGMVLLGVMKC